MRCVSYAQVATCYKGVDRERISIPDQNDHIKEYAKTRGLRISKKYSDRKADNKLFVEFEKMRVDGLNRTFDMLLTDSIWQCGKDVYQLVRVLEDSFYPAGIEFAIVEEDFCSLDHSREEVYEFLHELWHRYHGHGMEIVMQNKPNKLLIETYGYRYDRDRDQLEIEEESAAVVRKIFEDIRNGMTPSEIATDLTERGIEKPGDYQCRTKGWKLRGSNRGWSDGTVYKIAKSPKFAGRWERIIDGKDYAKDCPPIVDPELFDTVQEILASRRHHSLKCNKVHNPFLKMLTDEDTGAKIIMKKNQNTGVYDFHFQPKKPEGVRYERTCMLYDDAILLTRKELAKEKAKALAALSVIESDEGKSLVDRLIRSLRNRSEQYMQEIYRVLNSPDDHDLDVLASLYIEFDQICKDIMEVKKVYSRDNPWIKLFAEYDENTELTRSNLRIYADHVTMRRFEDIHLEIREKWWKDRIPPSWMEV